jgi:hypothetical protein
VISNHPSDHIVSCSTRFHVPSSPNSSDEFAIFLALGVAIAQHDPEAVTAECEETAAAQRGECP